MNWIFCTLWAFTHDYVNDIIIFFKTLKEHITYLYQIFELFQSLNISLKSKKFYLKYLTVTLLKQRVDNLSLITVYKKIKIIINLQFSTTLKNLNTYLRLINWLCFYISYYAQITESLQNRKILLLKTLSVIKENVQKQHTHCTVVKNSFSVKKWFFHILKNLFLDSIFLYHFNADH